MKIRTDFVTNSSSSSFSVIITVEDKRGKQYSFCDNPYDYNLDEGGSAWFTGSLKSILLEFQDAQFVEVLSGSYELDGNQDRKRIQTAEELHVGARVAIKEHNYSQIDGYVSIEVYRQNDSLGIIVIQNYGDEKKAEMIHRALQSDRHEISGIVTRVVPLSKRNANARKPLIIVRLKAEKKESDENLKDDRILAFDTVKELCEFLMESVEDDYVFWDDDDDEENECYRMEGDHIQQLEDSKETFIKNVTSKVKNISDIKKISVSREYDAYGEFADLIADNDLKLIEFAKSFMQSSGEERKKIMREMTTYINTPNSDRVGEEFGHGLPINYIWRYNDDIIDEIGEDKYENVLLELCERLTSNYGPGSVSGTEYAEVDAETGEYKEYADFYLA